MSTAWKQSRRHFLQAATSCLAVPLTLGSALADESSRDPKSGDGAHPRSRPFTDYKPLLATLKARGHYHRVLGHAPDRSPVVAVRCGGKRQPAIFISAGSHATEHAGVVSAVDLMDELQTEHEVWILPTRDPIGLSGFRYALSLGLGEQPQLESLADVEPLLRSEGEVLYDEGDTLLVQIGEIGYANRGLYRKFEPGSPFLDSLRGRRIYFPSRSEDQPGAERLARAYTLVVTPEGEILHLNRFHDTRWAPAEVACARRLMAELKPKLTLDLHEYGGDAFWFSARHQQTEEDEVWERRMAEQAIQAARGIEARLAPDDYSPGSFFSKMEQGVFWLEADKRGEGLNLIDFAAHRYGPGFTVETGMRQPFARRLQLHKLVTRTAVAVFEERYRS